MTLVQQIITLGVVCIGTLFTRFLSFFVFPPGKETPKTVQYLGRVLPAAVLGMLVIYCYKSIDFFHGVQGYLPALIAGILTAGLQWWKKSMFLSIIAGTACYMILIRMM